MENWINSFIDNNELVINSSIKLLRNFKDVNFVDSISIDKARKNIDVVDKIAHEELESDDFKLINSWECENNDIKSYIDKRLVSKSLLDRKDKSAFFINKDNTISIMVNGGDHIIINCVLGGCSFKEEFSEVNRIDDIIEKNIDYAFDDKLGYLTASPKNVGTGMKISAVIHLPVLNNKKLISSYSKQLSELGIKCCSLYGDKEENNSNLFLLYNSITLGIREGEIVNNLQRAIELLSREENKYRNEEMINNRSDIADKVFRAYGILKNARIMTSNELISLISHVRLGNEAGLLDISSSKISRLMMYASNSSIENNIGKNSTEKEKNIERARIVREILI